jgi:hypothetical protein
MIYAVVASLFVLQAVYVRFLFESFRRKVYLDVMDFVIERRKKEFRVDDDDESKPKRAHLKLV